MVAITLYDLERQKKPYRLDRDTRRADGEVKFPTREAAVKEDRLRVRCLENTSGLNSHEANLAQNLHKRMSVALGTDIPAKTLASAIYHRELRMPIIEALWRLAEEPVHQPCAFVTLRPHGMLFASEDLLATRPSLLMKRLRNDFDRSRVTAASGFGFFAVDCEFDANRAKGVWDFHFHGIASCEKIAAIENLRRQSKYDNARVAPLEQGLPVSARIQVKEGLYNLPDPITYCLESWVPHRPTTLQADGTLLRSATKSRIPSPDLQRWLIWMDQQRIEDFILLSNLTPAKSGFRLKRPSA